MRAYRKRFNHAEVKPPLVFSRWQPAHRVALVRPGILADSDILGKIRAGICASHGVAAPTTPRNRIGGPIGGLGLGSCFHGASGAPHAARVHEFREPTYATAPPGWSSRGRGGGNKRRTNPPYFIPDLTQSYRRTTNGCKTVAMHLPVVGCTRAHQAAWRGVNRVFMPSRRPKHGQNPITNLFKPPACSSDMIMGTST